MGYRLNVNILGIAILLSICSLSVSSQIPERIYGSKFREANRLLELAKLEIRDKQYQQALALLNRCLQYQSDNIDAYFNRAIVKENIEDPEGAFTDYQIVLLLDSTYREAAFNRAKLRYKGGQFNRAIGDFNKVLTMGSSGTQQLYFKGTPLNSEGQVAVDGITTTHSMDADIYNYLGLCYQSLEQHSTAIEIFDKAIGLNPNDANYYVNRGLSHAYMDDSEKAITDFKYALELNPGHPIAQFNLTRELETSGNLEIVAYDDIIDNNPEFASAYVNRAMAKLNAGDVQGALDDYDKAISIDHNNPILYVNRALALEKTGELMKALEDYNRAISLDGEDAKAYRSRGRVLFELEKYQLALDDLNEAINLDPDFGGAYFNRALIHRKLGDHYQTCKDLTEAQTLGVSNATKAITQYCPDAVE